MTSSEYGAELLIYAEDGVAQIFLRAEDGTVWPTQLEPAELFQTTKQNVSLHIKNILMEGELPPLATVKEYLTVQIEGKRQIKRPVQLYNLDLSREHMVTVAYERYEEFDAKRRQVEARRANDQDIEELEVIEKTKRPIKPRKGGGNVA